MTLIGLTYLNWVTWVLIVWILFLLVPLIIERIVKSNYENFAISGQNYATRTGGPARPR